MFCILRAKNMMDATHVQRQSEGEEPKVVRTIQEGREEPETHLEMDRNASNRPSPGPSAYTKVHAADRHSERKNSKIELQDEAANIWMVYVQGKSPMMPTASLNTAATRSAGISQASTLNRL